MPSSWRWPSLPPRRRRCSRLRVPWLVLARSVDNGGACVQVACKALASINWFVDKEVQNKTRELGGLDIVRRVREAQAEHPVVAATCQQVMARIDEKPAPVDDPEDLYT